MGISDSMYISRDGLSADCAALIPEYSCISYLSSYASIAL